MSHNLSSTACHADAAQRSDALTTACATPRFSPYRFIHKGLRALMFDTLRNAGALDATLAPERAQLVDEVERLLAICADHLAHENQFFHEALRQHAPRAVLPFHEDHLEHVEAIDHLSLLLQRVRDADEQHAASLAYELYLRLTIFIGENLAHMAEEESVLTQALWAHFSDAEIMAIETALHATLAPEEMAFYLRWMARGMNASEIVMVLGGARPQLPAAAFDQMTEIVQAELQPARWARVASALGLPPVPGLIAT